MPAVIHGDRRFTCRAAGTGRPGWLPRCANPGVRRGDTVSVMLANTPEMIEAHYAVPGINAVLDAEHPARCGPAGRADEPLRDPR